MNWISVKDSLPAAGKEVLIYHIHGQRQVGEFNINKKWSVYYKGHLVEQGGVTHWMPLPAPPKEHNKTDLYTQDGTHLGGFEL